MTRIHKEQINNPYLCPDVINIIIDKILLSIQIKYLILIY
jgi:hypothetical protein